MTHGTNVMVVATNLHPKESTMPKNVVGYGISLGRKEGRKEEKYGQSLNLLFESCNTNVNQSVFAHTSAVGLSLQCFMCSSDI